jgi:hypothetical protein
MVIGFLAAVILSSVIVPSIASVTGTYRQVTVMYDNIKVVANGRLIDESVAGIPINPFMINGVTYIPARAIGEALCDGVTSWDDSTKTLYLGSRYFNANRTYKLSELKYHTALGSNLRHVNEARDSTDTFQKDCLLRDTESIVPNRYIDYSLNKEFSRIEGTYFLQYGSRDSTRKCDLKIWGDGVLLYTFEGMTAGVPPISFSVDVRGVETLKIGFEHRHHGSGAPGVGLGNVTLFP